MTHPDIIDLISNAILDAIDIDWTTDDAARAVYKALLAEGLLAGQPNVQKIDHKPPIRPS